MAKPLNEQIRAALSGGSRASTISDLIATVKTEIAVQEKRLEIENAESVNPLLETADQDEAADRAAKADRELKRLNNSIGMLEQTLEKRINSDKAKAAKKRYDEVKMERDAIAAELKKWGEKDLPKLIKLLARVMINDAALDAVNGTGGHQKLESAEAIARGVPRNFYIGNLPVSRLTKWKIPVWDGNGNAWPDQEVWKNLPQSPVGGG